MKLGMMVAVLASIALGVASASAAERNLADGLAAAGVATAAKGNTAQAKELFYTALVHDENCPDALFELAKIVDKEGDAAMAGDLYQRAALILAQEGKAPTFYKRAEAEKRAKALNPVAAKLTAVFEEYSQDLDKVVKKLPDPLTEATATERVNDLQMSGVLPADKMPKFFATAQAEKDKKPVASNTEPPPNDRRNPRKPKVEGTTSPEVERELKTLGWATVTGVWTKKSPGVYEASDGKLEALKTNGTLEFTVLRGGGDGSIKATVRTEGKNNDMGGPPAPPDNGGRGGGWPGWGEPEMSGYGIYYRGKDFKDFGFGEKGGRGPGPKRSGVTSLGTYPVPESVQRNRFVIKVDDTTVELFHNEGHTNRSSNVKLSKTGPFVLEVIGTVTIENPRCVGQ